MKALQICSFFLLCLAPVLAEPVQLLPEPIDVDHKFLVQKAVVDIGPDKDFTRTKVKFTVKNISGRTVKVSTFQKKSLDEPWFGFDLGLPPGSKDEMSGTALGPIRTSDIAPNEVFTVEPLLSLPGQLKFPWIQLTYKPYFGSQDKKTITERIPLSN